MIFTINGCSIDTHTFEMRRRGELVSVEPQVFDLLILLAGIWIVAVTLRPLGLPTIMGELIVGVIVGTYSSIAIAASLLLIGVKAPAPGGKASEEKPTRKRGGKPEPVGAVR